MFAEGHSGESEETEKKNDGPGAKKSKQDPTNVYEFDAESQLPPSKRANHRVREGRLATGSRSGIGEVTSAESKSNFQVIIQLFFVNIISFFTSYFVTPWPKKT